MIARDEARAIADAVRGTFRDAELPWPPEPTGPVPLDRLIESSGPGHEEIQGLNFAEVSRALRRRGVEWAEIPDPDPSLAGFLYANARNGFIFVRRGDGLPRRRFTAAHELGHYRLHLAPELACRDPDVGLIQADVEVVESDGESLADMERQANRFAAELLMPEGVCRALFARYAEAYGPVPRFLIHHLAGDLLVSREAIGWRLVDLGLIERQPWMGKGPGGDDVESDGSA